MKIRGLILTLAVVLLLSGANIFLFTNEKGASYSAISGLYLEDSSNLPLGLNLSVVAFVIQWIVLLAILFFAYSKFLRHKKHENLNLSYSGIRIKKSRASTDLDTLFVIIKDKKSLSMESIAKFFNITKEKALEWCKILENHELVNIEYPAFSAPEVKLHEEKEEIPSEEGKEKDKDKKGEEKQKGKKIKGKEGQKLGQKTKSGEEQKGKQPEEEQKDKQPKEKVLPKPENTGKQTKPVESEKPTNKKLAKPTTTRKPIKQKAVGKAKGKPTGKTRRKKK